MASSKFIKLEGIDPGVTIADIRQTLRTQFGEVPVIFPFNGKTNVAVLELDNSNNRDIYMNNLKKRGLLIRGKKILVSLPTDDVSIPYLVYTSNMN